MSARRPCLLVAVLASAAVNVAAQSGLTTAQTLGRHAPADILALKRPVQVRDASLIAGAVNHAGLVVAAQRYAVSPQEGLFSVDLAAAGIVPVQLTVSNNSRVKVLVSNRVHLGSSGIRPLTGAQVFSRTERSTKGSGVLLNIMSLGQGTTALRLDTEAANEAVAANFHLKSLRDRVLLPGETVSAFVFFDQPQLAGAGNELFVPVLSLDRVAMLSVIVPVSGLAADATATATAAPGRLAVAPASVAAPVAGPVATPAAPVPPTEQPRRGQVQLPNGDRYEGDLVGVVRTGKGRYFYTNGDRYEGEFQRDKPHGAGVHWYSHGDRYEGQFNAGEQSGSATYYYASGDRYVGPFVAGRREGRGVHHFLSGDRYEGSFRSGELAGEGTYFYANGDRYVGQFAGGVRHGRGVYHFKSGESRPMAFDNGKELPP